MRSFSSFKPVIDGTPTEVRQRTFAMWLRANAKAIKEPYDPRTWRTARPWLTFHEVHKSKEIFLKKSLGAILFGSATLTDDDVKRAVQYEAICTKQISTEEILNMVYEFFTFSRSGELSQRVVRERINEEFTRAGRGTVIKSNVTWRKAFRKFSLDKVKCTLKPKIHECEVARLIQEMFEPAKTVTSAEEIHFAISPILQRKKEILSVESIVFQRALQMTGLFLKPKNHRHVIDTIIDKFYLKHHLAKESLTRLQFVVNQFADIPEEAHVWSFIDLNITPRHEYKMIDFEECISPEYQSVPDLTELQKPFFKYAFNFKYIRKKQKLPWLKIFEKCYRAGGTDNFTIQKINEYISQLGFTPYHESHSIFDIVKVQGLQWREEY